MKKAYSLDYSIERDVDRVAAIKDILDQLPTDPSPTELEQMGSYILYGKDENGRNSIQRGETTDGKQRRFNSFQTAEDKVISLDEVLENPMADQQDLMSAHKRSVYNLKKSPIRRPKYSKKTGELIDIGDGDIPGIQDLWERIDHLEHWIAILEKKIPPDETTTVIEVDSYRLYQLKHQLIDMRRHQYYLRDSYKPTLFFAGMDHPKQQFIDWSSDSAYWMPRDQWERKVSNSLLSSVSRNIEDYETRDNGQQVKWVVRRHTFDWENYKHVRALATNYDAMYEFFREKLDTYGRALLFDFDRYREMANLSDVRNFILDCKIQKMSYTEIGQAVQAKFDIYYDENHLSEILAQEIPQKIAAAARKHRLILDTPPENCKKCCRCGRTLPRDTLFYSRNSNRKDGFGSACKECERQRRIERGGSVNDRRSKEAQVSKVQIG